MLLASCLVFLSAPPVQQGEPSAITLNDEQTLAITPSAPSAPLNLTADRGDGFVWLWWEHPANQGSEPIKRYAIYRGTTPGGEASTPIDHVGVGVNFYEDTGVTNGNTYYYRISAMSDYGEGVNSSEVSASPSATGDAPGAPTNVQVTNEEYSAKISFSPPTDEGSTTVRYYSLYRGDSPATINYMVSINTDDWKTLEFVDTMAYPGFDYYYAVKAENSYGEGANSTPTMVHVGGTGTVPSAPQNLTTTPSDGMVMLYWEEPVNPSENGILRYDIYRGTTSGGEDPTPIGNVTGIDIPPFYFPPFTVYMDDNVTNDQMYWYEVKAVGNGGSSPASNEAFGVPSQIGIEPDAPILLLAEPGDGQVLLLWIGLFYQPGYVVNVTGFDIYRSTTENTTGTKIATVDPSNYDYWDNSSSNGVTYYYKLKALYGGGESDLSNEISATPSATGPLPDAPTGLLATPYFSGVELDSDYPDESSPFVLGYQVFRSTIPGGQGAVPLYNISEAYGGPLSDIDNSATDLTTYYYKVKAVGMYGVSDLSEEAYSFPSIEGDPPEPSEGLTASAVSGGIELEWDNPYSGTATYVSCMVLRHNGSSEWKYLYFMNVMLGEQGTYTDALVEPGVTYHYKIEASNNYGGAELSNEASATASGGGTEPPTAPQNLEAASSDGEVILTWDAPTSSGDSPITRYDVYRGASAGSIDTLIGDVAAGTLTYQDTDVTNGETYHYQVKAVNSYGSSPASNTAQATPSAEGSAPGAPMGLTAMGHYLSISLNWSVPSDVGSGVSNYLVFRGTSAGGESSTPIATVPGGTLTYTDNDVDADTPYYYKVKANNTYGSSAYSNEASATASNETTGTPSAPRNLVATSGTEKVTLVWEIPASDGGSAITGYMIYRSLGGISEYQATVGSTILTYEDTNGTVGTEYTYIVKAVNGNGVGDDSSPVTAASQAADDGGIDPVIIAVVVVVVVVAIAAVGIFWWMKR